MNHSTPGLPIQHQLPEFTQTHVHRVSWCHPAISSSVVPFSSCPQSLPASESFPMSQLFAWGGQNTGVSALASFLTKNTQDWSPLFLFFFKFYFIFKLYIIVLVLPNIKMNPPQVYMCSPSWTLLPPPSPYHPYKEHPGLISFRMDWLDLLAIQGTLKSLWLT